MKEFRERQTELLCYLNDNCIEATELTKSISEIMDIEFIDDENSHGWFLISHKVL